MASLSSAFTHRDPLEALPLPAVSSPPERNEDGIPVFLGPACRAWKSSQKLLSDEGNLVGTPCESQDNGRRGGTQRQECDSGRQTDSNQSQDRCTHGGATQRQGSGIGASLR
jgi:hypothetical protein